MLLQSEIYRLVNDYIEVRGGYLGDFSYRTHYEFYPHYCDIELDVEEYEPGTTREKFVRILNDVDSSTQARIIRGVFKKYPVYNFPEEQRDIKQALYEEYQEIIDRLERDPTSPSDSSVSAALVRLDANYAMEIWEKTLERRIDDPDAAVTEARTLLESTCKHILDDFNVDYPSSVDLPKLYRLTAEQLNLAPSQHTEQIFKQILGSCQSVIQGLGSVRNALGDAHGKGRKPVRPASRHAELAVNLAGTMAIFLIRTWENNNEASD